MKCKTCGAELEPVGRLKEFWQFYRCPNGCNHNEDKGRPHRISDSIFVGFAPHLINSSESNHITIRNHKNYQKEKGTENITIQ